MHGALEEILQLAASLDEECSSPDLATSCTQLLHDDGSDEEEAIELLVQFAPLVEKAIFKSAKHRKIGDIESMKHMMQFFSFYQLVDNHKDSPGYRKCMFQPGNSFCVLFSYETASVHIAVEFCPQETLTRGQCQCQC